MLIAVKCRTACLATGLAVDKLGSDCMIGVITVRPAAVGLLVRAWFVLLVRGCCASCKPSFLLPCRCLWCCFLLRFCARCREAWDDKRSWWWGGVLCGRLTFCPYAGNIASAIYAAARGMWLAKRRSSTRDIYMEIFDFVMCILACIPKNKNFFYFAASFFVFRYLI